MCLGGMGAYTYTAKSTFNGMNSGVKYYVCDEEISSIGLDNVSDINKIKEEETSFETIVWALFLYNKVQ